MHSDSTFNSYTRKHIFHYQKQTSTLKIQTDIEIHPLTSA